MLDPIDVMIAMQDLMDKPNCRYPFAITYKVLSTGNVDVEIQPVLSSFCKYPLLIWGDNDNHATPIT